MVQQNKILIIILALLVCVTPAHAFWNFWSVDTSAYDECLTYRDDNSCSNEYCDGYENNIVCSYENEANKNLMAELFPMNCGAIGKWNESEEVQFIYSVNVDADDHVNHKRVCQGVSEQFPQFYHLDTYQVPYEVINNVKLREKAYLDPFGAFYLEKPTKTEIRDIYSGLDREDQDDVYKRISEIDLNPQSFGVAFCKIDCDYQGENDNDLNMPVNSDGRKGGVTTDFSSSTIFLDNADIITWKEIWDEEYDEKCNWYDRWFNSYECGKLEALDYIVEDNLKFITPESDQYDYTYFYTDQTNTASSYTCSYPKEQYTDTQVTTKVSCAIAKTREAIMFTENADKLSYDRLGLTCDPRNPFCVLDMNLTFYLNSTTGDINYVDSDFGQQYESQEETLDEAVEQMTPIIEYLVRGDEGYENPGVYEDPKFKFQTSRNDIIQNMLELGEYVISVILIVNYLIQFFLFGIAIKLFVNAFRYAIDAFYDLFEIGKKPGGDLNK